MHTISQITNLKIIGDVLGLRECYQCGGETLDPGLFLSDFARLPHQKTQICLDFCSWLTDGGRAATRHAAPAL